MGLTLEFLAGDCQFLISAFREADLDTLYEPPVCLYRADFSLHLVPLDLDLLSECLGELAGISPIPLRSFLTGVVDKADCGALAVGKKWVDYVAACGDSIALPASKRWTEKMKRAHPHEEIELTEEMTEAVRSLLVLCRNAKDEKLDVLHLWFG